MSILKNKSELNFASAELLFKHNYHPSVVHCAYYSCIQLMKHIWLHKMNKTELELKTLTQNNKLEGSHEVLINQIVTFINSKSQNSRDFNNFIGQLKKLRNKADYQDVQIDSSISQNSITLSQNTSTILKQCL